MLPLLKKLVKDFMVKTIDIVCPCGQFILKSLNDSIKLRSKIILFDEHGRGIAVCKSCGREHIIPVALTFTKGVNEIKHVLRIPNDKRTNK